MDDRNPINRIENRPQKSDQSHYLIQQLIQNSMEILSIRSLTLTIASQADISHQPWLYCVVKSDFSYCTKSAQARLNKQIELITPAHPHELSLDKVHPRVRVEVWDYDQVKKLGQVNLTDTHIPKNGNTAELLIVDTEKREIKVGLYYERKQTVSENAVKMEPMLRLSTNKSTSSLRSSAKFSDGPIPTNYTNPTRNEEPRAKMMPYYDASAFGRWKFISSSNKGSTPSNHEQKLKL